MYKPRRPELVSGPRVEPPGRLQFLIGPGTVSILDPESSSGRRWRVILRLMDKWPAVYILASKFRGTLYIGVTSDLLGRIWEHRSGIKSKFPAKYAVHRLVYVETLGDMDSAISREKQLKRWHRQWKINLIEADNPHWIDLAVGLGFEPLPNPSP